MPRLLEVPFHRVVLCVCMCARVLTPKNAPSGNYFQHSIYIYKNFLSPLTLTQKIFPELLQSPLLIWGYIYKTQHLLVCWFPLVLEASWESGTEDLKILFPIPQILSTSNIPSCFWLLTGSLLQLGQLYQGVPWTPWEWHWF